ncbi:hypothetical protein OHB26_12565 [Nocardia sp. NBC_01503]|uniref:hypothetical protein n=1 Tax=Nocardia sp. NBC_01503 TaxID=2975997 RepID=UPI002E7C119F|nr:hypothetical protein [Nocardia sp. NBC_01503]WTL34948.1 hypothetical protein OHB26_12565 [Nocardia sp. NBC_01503]
MNADPHARWFRLLPAGYSLALALLVLGPLSGPGYLLLRDAVSTPRSYLTDSALGLGDAAPRAVPQDALIATLSPLIDGSLIVKAILLVALWLAGWGAARLARELLGVSTGPQLVAATIAIWNPYVAERLLQGHWSLLTGYAALPWIALLANRLRIAHTPGVEPRTDSPVPAAARDPAATPHSAPTVERTVTARPCAGAEVAPSVAARTGMTSRAVRSTVTTAPGPARRVRAWRDWAALGGWLALAGLTPTGSLFAGCVACLLVGRRNAVGALGLWLAASAPWLTATVLAGSGAEPSDPAGVAAFAARAEPWLGTLGSLAGLGGIWNSTAVPDSRTTFFALIGTAILLALVTAGVRAVLARDDFAMAEANPSNTGRSAMPDRRAAAMGEEAESAAAENATPESDLTPSLATTATGGTKAGAAESRTPSSSPRGSASARELDTGAPRTRRMLIGLAVLAVVLPTLGATGWGLSAGQFLVTKAPGAGLLRDTQKFVALAMPAFALCAAAGCRTIAGWIAAKRADPDQVAAGDARTDHSEAGSRDAAAGRSADHGETSTERDASRGGSARRGRRPVAAVAAVFIVLVLISLPDMAWGVGGALRPVRYPGGWEQVATMVKEPGDVAVLPGGMFRKFRWAGNAPVLDPAPRMLPRDVLQTGELPVPGATVSGEGRRAREVEQLLLHGGSAEGLARLGVGWVLVEGGTPGPMGESKTTLSQLNPVYSDRDLQLYRVPGSIASHDASAAARRTAGAAHLLWAVLLCGGVVSVLSRSVNPASTRRRSASAARP